MPGINSSTYIYLLVLGLLTLIAVGIVVAILKVQQGRSGSGVPRLSYREHLKEADQLYKQYHYAEALQHYLAAIRISNKDHMVHYRIGRVYMMLKDLSGAERAYLNVLRLAPDFSEALYELAQVYYRHKNPKIALSYVNKLLLQSPSHIPGLKLKAHILAELEEFDQSAALLKELVEQNPNNADLVLLLGSVLHKAGKWQEALQTYQTLLDSDPSDSKNVRFQIYQVYVDEGMFEKAIATLNQILTEETGTISQTKLRTEMANCYCRKADDSFERGLLNDAMESYNKAKEWDENHQGIYMGLGKLYCQQEDYDKASEAYKRVMDLGVADESLYLEIASIYERMDRFDEAISYLKSIERTNPSAQIFYYLGTLYGLKGDMENCIDYLNKTIHRSPRFVDAYYNLGVAYEQHKRIKEAINMYKKVLELDSSHEEAKANLKFLKSKQYKPSV